MRAAARLAPRPIPRVPGGFTLPIAGIAALGASSRWRRGRRTASAHPRPPQSPRRRPPPPRPRRVLRLRGVYEDYVARYDYTAADLRVALEVLADLEGRARAAAHPRRWGLAGPTRRGGTSGSS